MRLPSSALVTFSTIPKPISSPTLSELPLPLRLLEFLLYSLPLFLVLCESPFLTDDPLTTNARCLDTASFSKSFPI